MISRRKIATAAALLAAVTLAATATLAGAREEIHRMSSCTINVAAQYGTNDAAIRKAIRAAEEKGCDLYFRGDTTFRYDDVLVLDGLAAYGDGSTTVLRASDPTRSAIILTGQGPELRRLKVASPNSSMRRTNSESSSVLVRDAAGFTVARVIAVRPASVGFFVTRSSYGKLLRSSARNTFADGIHVTDRSHHVEVAYNSVQRSRDDMIGLVSYRSNGDRIHHINVHHNKGDNSDVADPHGRGIAVAGGRDIQLNENSVKGTAGAGIYIASEPGWATYGVDDVKVNKNVVRKPAREIHNANILIWAAQADYPVRNVTRSGNNLDRAETAVRKITENGGYYSGISIGWFYRN